MFLRMQINVYARFFDISNGERIETQARAVCTTTVLQFYYSSDNRVIIYPSVCHNFHTARYNFHTVSCVPESGQGSCHSTQ